MKTSLATLHEEIEGRARGWSNPTIVTMHGSFGYFAERYGLAVRLDSWEPAMELMTTC